MVDRLGDRLGGRVDVIDFIGNISDQMVAKLYDIAHQARAAGSTKMLLRIASEGGSYSAAFAAYNLFMTTGIPLQAHNIGDVKNEALVLYLAADTRSMAAYTQFLIEETPQEYDYLRRAQLVNSRTSGLMRFKPYGNNEPLSIAREAAIKLGLVNDEIVVPNFSFADAVFWNVSTK